jgi:hypothetical protein
MVRDPFVKCVPLLVAGMVVTHAVAVIASQAAQKPSFSGTWIIQPPNKAAGRELTVKQDDKTMSVTSAGRTRTYQLNGVESREAMSTRVGEIVMVSKAAWEGRSIVITTVTSYPNDMKTTEKETWSISSQGELVIDFVETAPGQPPRPMKITHKKKS